MHLVGQTRGRYRIIGSIGARGMTTAYRGYHAGPDRFVTIKVSSPQHTLVPGFKEHFFTEAGAVSRLSHPNILPIYDFGIEDDIHYLVAKRTPPPAERSPPQPTPAPAGDPGPPTRPPGDERNGPGRWPDWATGSGGLLLAGLGLLILIVTGALVLFGVGGEPTPDGTITGQPSVMESSGNPTRTPRPGVTPEAASRDLPAPTEIFTGTADARLLKELARLGRGTITAVAASPDGATLAVAGSLGVWLYDTETLEPLGLLEGHTAPVTDVAWSPEGMRLASASKDSTLRVWRIPEGETLLVLRGHVGSVASVAWSPDGRRLASGGWDNTVRIWLVPDETGLAEGAADGGELSVLSGHTEAVLGLAWSPDGTQLASASRDGTLRLWRVTVGAAGAGEDGAGARQTGLLEGHTKAITSVAWSPDGTQLASASEDKAVRIWTLPASAGPTTSVGQPLVLQGHTSYVQSVAWSPDGAQLASGGLDRTVHVWDATSGEEQFTLQGHSQPLREVLWLPDGSGLLSGGDDGTVRVWSLAQRVELRALTGHGATVLSVAWSPDGAQLAAGSKDGTVAIWALSPQEALSAGAPLTGTQLRRLEGHRSEVNSVAWSPDGTQLATAGGVLDAGVLLWDMDRPGMARILTGHTSAVTSVAWSPDGSELASASWDNTVRVWDAAGRPLHLLTDHTNWALNVAWSPDGTQLASGGRDGTIRIWHAATETQRHVLKGHIDLVTSVAWSSDGTRLASTGWDGTLRIWDATTGGEQLVLGTPGDMTSVVWSPDGMQLAMVSEFRDNLARIWDAASGRELYTLEGHLDTVKAVAWSPDGPLLATASADGTLRVWGMPVED